MTLSSDRTAFELDCNPYNPGQYAACCGVLDVANRLWPGATGRFLGRVFYVTLPGTESAPLKMITETITQADPLAELAEDAPAYEGDEGSRTRYQITPFVLLPASPARMRIDWWLDRGGRIDKRHISLWAASVVLWAPPPARGDFVLPRLVKALREMTAPGGTPIGRTLLTDRVRLSAGIGIDPSAITSKGDVGYSPGEHSGARYLAHIAPATEVFGLIGLQGFCPQRRGNAFEYTVWHGALPYSIARAASRGAVAGGYQLQFHIVARGKHQSFGYARLKRTT